MLQKGKERLLLIDTCGETAGVALSSGRQVLVAEDLAQGKASIEIVSAVRRGLKQAEWNLAELDAIGVVSGPGSFTGIRAGLAVAKGLCESTGLPLIAVSRLEVLAEVASLRDGFAVLDAGRRELYVREESGGHEWLCSDGSLVAIAEESKKPLISVNEKELEIQTAEGDSKKDARIVIAEECLAERLARCEPALHPLHVGDALRVVLRRLHEEGSDVSLTDANYVRVENDIYRSPATAKPIGVEK